ncbi:MAG: response regulator [Pseudomonadales bacterium]
MATPLLPLMLVEDDEADVKMVQIALRSAQVHCDMSVSRSGREALDSLSRSRRQGQQPFEVVLLDLGLPDQSGLEVLDRIREESWLEDTLVIALTGSKDPETIQEVYKRGAHSFMSKPINVHEFVDLLRSFGYWLSLSRN